MSDPSPKTTSRSAGAAALAVVLLAWLVVILTILSISTSSGTGDVAYGLAMMAFITGSGTALTMSVIAALMSIITLRRQRDATMARVALVLALLMLVSSAGLGLWMFWPAAS